MRGQSVSDFRRPTKRETGHNAVHRAAHLKVYDRPIVNRSVDNMLHNRSRARSAKPVHILYFDGSPAPSFRFLKIGLFVKVEIAKRATRAVGGQGISVRDLLNQLPLGKLFVDI